MSAKEDVRQLKSRLKVEPALEIAEADFRSVLKLARKLPPISHAFLAVAIAREAVSMLLSPGRPHTRYWFDAVQTLLRGLHVRMDWIKKQTTTEELQAADEAVDAVIAEFGVRKMPDAVAAAKAVKNAMSAEPSLIRITQFAFATLEQNTKKPIRLRQLWRMMSDWFGVVDLL